jgi:hypothetical protein
MCQASTNAFPLVRGVLQPPKSLVTAAEAHLGQRIGRTGWLDTGSGLVEEA